MKITRKRVNRVCVIFFCILFLVIGQAIFAQTESHSDEKEKDSDKAQKYPKKRKSRETWETIVSLPGTILFFPLKIIFKGSEEIAKFLSENQTTPKIHDFLVSDDGRRSALPKYSARTGGGLVYTQRGLFTQESKMTIHATAGLRFRREFKASLQSIQLSKSLYADVLGRYRLLTDEPFYGLGNESPQSRKSTYSQVQIAAELTFGLKLSKKVSTYTQIGYQVNEIGGGRNKNLPSVTDRNLYTEETLPGLTTRVKLSNLKLAFHYDGRNHLGRPTAGSELIFGGAVFNELGGDDFGFWKASLDFSHYINLFNKRILVLRIMGELSEPFSGKKIPFYHMSSLGSRETVRGYHRGQFRSKDMILGSLEYRYPIWHLFDTFLFVDAGKVSEDIFKDFSTKGFHVGYGTGIRIWGEKGMVAKFEVAKSPNGIRLYFTLGKGIIG